jgi:FAD/FMN-containing dehydrogenase
MDTTHTFPLPFDEPTRVEQVSAVCTVSAAPALIWPGSAEYDTARLAWNLHADQYPACICVAQTVADVRAAVAYAGAAGLTVAPQGTGHLATALPSLERTLLLKTALHDGEVEVDPIKRTARIKAGARWGDVVDAVTPHGLAVMHGSSPSVGVIGYLLGGGLSFYGRRHGLAVNHVRALEVVTPDGVLRHVDAEHHRDLFYALRGGGGGYAIVTAVEIGLLPYSEVTGGALFFAAEDVRRVLRAWVGWTAQASDAITTTFRVLNLPPLPEVPEPLQGITSVCVDGVALDPAQAEQLEARLRHAATPILGGFGPMPTTAVVRLHGDPGRTRCPPSATA